MPIDTSIYNMAGRVKSVADYDQEALLRDQAKQQQQLTALQIMQGRQKADEYSRGVERSNALRALAGRWTAETTDDQRITDLKNSGFASEADQLQGGVLKRQETEAKVMDEKAKAQKTQLETAATRLGLVLNVVSAAKDQASYTQGKAFLAQQGLDVSGIPDVFDPAMVKAAGQQAMTALQRVQEEQKRLDLAERARAADQTAAVQKRGQDVAASTARRGQDISAGTAAARLQFDQTKDNLDRTQPKPKAAGPMSATLQKELIESDDAVAANASIKATLTEALSLNDKAYSGVGAKSRAVVRSNLPGESEEANATINLDNMMTGQALESLKAIFGGMPTEGERKILLDMQASADKTPSQRKAIIERAMAAAERRGALAKAKARAIREGTYLTEGAQVPEAPPAAGAFSDAEKERRYQEWKAKQK